MTWEILRMCVILFLILVSANAAPPNLQIKNISDSGPRGKSASISHSTNSDITVKSSAKTPQKSSLDLTSHCPMECSGHGVCTISGCICYDGWSGLQCNIRSCPNNCNDRGACVLGKCKCIQGYEGEDCSIEVSIIEEDDIACPKNCSSNGVCNLEIKKCICKEGYIGRDCSQIRCPNECSNNGTCQEDGHCSCSRGFGGLDCSIDICPQQCSGLGVCTSYGCLCYEGNSGSDCSVPMNTNDAHEERAPCITDENCSNRGICLDGLCLCNSGFVGDCGSVDRAIFTAICKRNATLYTRAFDSQYTMGKKTW